MCPFRLKKISKLFRKSKNVRYMEIGVRLPPEISKEEAALIDGWVIGGSLRTNPPVRFFLPSLHWGENVYPRFEVAGDLEKESVEFSAVPEAKGTKFEGLFEFSGRPQQQISPVRCAAPGQRRKIDFNRIGVRDEDGFYPIVCPFCFKTFSHRDFEFRARCYDDNKECFKAEPDEKYREFCESNNYRAGPGVTRGKAIGFGSGGEIRSFSYVGAPDTFLGADENTELRDVVNVVVDKFGNPTSDKLCPHCHNSLPVMSGKFPNVLISMMGNTGSGKSVYMMQMIHLINSGRLLPGCKFRCTPNRNARSWRVLAEYKEIFEDVHVDGGEADALRRQADFGEISFEKEAGPEPSAHEPFAMQTFKQFGAPGDGFEALNADWGPVHSFADPAPVPEQSRLPLEFASVPSPAGDAQLRVSSIVNWDAFSLSDSDSSGPTAVPLPEATTRQFEEPCIYEVIGTDAESGKSVGFILSVFDFPGEAIWGANAPGEAVKHDRHLEKVTRHASGFVFVFDPSTVGRIRTLPRERRDRFIEATLGAQASRNQTLLNQMPKDILRSFRGKFGNPVAKFRAPIAMVLSKSDAIRDQFDDLGLDLANFGAHFLEENPDHIRQNRADIDAAEMRKCSEAIKAFLGEPDLDSECEAIAENYLWFAVSATGIAPSDGTLQGRHGVPVRVLDPIEWILSESARKQGEA